MPAEARSVYLYCNARDVNDATRHYVALLRAGFAEAGFADLGVGNDATVAAQASDLLTLNVPFAQQALKRFPQARLHHWFQGLESIERAYLHGGLKGWLQRVLFAAGERHILRKACSLVFVSDAMRQHYRDQQEFEAPHHVMPCYAHARQLPLSGNDMRYARPDMAYAGSLHRWQCVPDVLAVFKLLLAQRPDAKLTLYTRETSAARALCEQAGLGQQVAVVESTLDALPGLLQRHAYGLLLRDNLLLNAVSTPTKFSSYLTAGLIPVLTGHTPALDGLGLAPPYRIQVQMPGAHRQIADAILARCEEAPSPQAVHQAFAAVFQNTYNDALQTKQLARLFSEAAC